MHSIQRFALTRFDVELDRVIGDSQVSTGLPFDRSSRARGRRRTRRHRLLPRRHRAAARWPELQAGSERELAEQVIGASPFAWVNRLERPRGARIRTSVFSPSVEQAMWDLQGQILGLPLYKLLGGERSECRPTRAGSSSISPTSRSSASTLNARAAGFSAFKVKVGHPDLTAGTSDDSDSCRKPSAATAC